MILSNWFEGKGPAGQADSGCGVYHSSSSLIDTMDLRILLSEALPTPVALRLLFEHVEQSIFEHVEQRHHEFRASGKHAAFGNGVLI